MFFFPITLELHFYFISSHSVCLDSSSLRFYFSTSSLMYYLYSLFDEFMLEFYVLCNFNFVPLTLNPGYVFAGYVKGYRQVMKKTKVEGT